MVLNTHKFPPDFGLIFHDMPLDDAPCGSFSIFSKDFTSIAPPPAPETGGWLIFVWKAFCYVVKREKFLILTMQVNLKDLTTFARAYTLLSLGLLDSENLKNKAHWCKRCVEIEVLVCVWDLVRLRGS